MGAWGSTAHPLLLLVVVWELAHVSILSRAYIISNSDHTVGPDEQVLATVLVVGHIDELLLIGIDLLLSLSLEAAMRSCLLLLHHNRGVSTIPLRWNFSIRDTILIYHCLWIEVVQKVYLILSKLVWLLLITHKITDLGKIRCQDWPIRSPWSIILLLFLGIASGLDHHWVMDRSIGLSISLHETHGTRSSRQHRYVIDIFPIIKHWLILAKVYNILLIETIIIWSHLLFAFLLLICRDTVLLTYDNSLAPICEIDYRYIFVSVLIMLTLAISTDAGIELSVFWISILSCIRGLVLKLMGSRNNTWWCPVVRGRTLIGVDLFARVYVVRGLNLTLTLIRELLIPSFIKVIS